MHALSKLTMGWSWLGKRNVAPSLHNEPIYSNCGDDMTEYTDKMLAYARMEVELLQEILGSLQKTKDNPPQAKPQIKSVERKARLDAKKILQHMQDCGGITGSPEIAERYGVSSNTGTNKIKELIAGGYVRKVKHGVYALTDKGHENARIQG